MAETNELLPFSVLNEAIQTYLPDPAIADTKFFNLYKVYQHALTYTLNNDEKKKFRHYLNAPLSIQVTRYALKGMRRKAQKPLKKTLIFDENHRQINNNGQLQSFYFSKTMALLERNEYSILQKSAAPKGSFDFSLADFEVAGNIALDRTEVELLKEINRLAKEAKNIPLPGFTDYLYPALQLFFEFFHRYYWAFKGQSIERLFFTCHYHNESLLAACKVLNIETIEYQHGLITRNDVYYVYPEMMKKWHRSCLFPDKIVVYGEFWKSMLLEGYEFSDDQIIIGGSTGHIPEIRSKAEQLPKENALLITTQTCITDGYVAYAQHVQRLLQANYPDWKLLIKLHPNQIEAEKFDVFKDLPNCEVHGKSSALTELFERAKAQITIYSTTLYDALGFDVINLSLQHDPTYADYAAEMVQSQVAFPINFEDDPVERYTHFSRLNDDFLKRDSVYAPFRADVIQALLRGEAIG